MGTPCIYYGTEQGFYREGEGDWNIREAMFNLKDTTTNVLNKNNSIYKEIATIAAIRKASPVLKFGRMYMRDYSNDGKTFQSPIHPECMIAFSRVLYDEELLIVYNDSLKHVDEEYIMVSKDINPEGSVLDTVMGPQVKYTY